jgi:hypothetical protein
LNAFLPRLRIRLAGLQTDWRTLRLSNQVTRHALVDEGKKPVIIFNASTRLNTLSQNAAFALLTSWAVRLSGRQVIHFVCQAGMSHCVLGTNQDNPARRPPCQACMRQTRLNTWAAKTQPFNYQEDANLATRLKDMQLDELAGLEVPLGDINLPLGKLVLPSMRWRLRRQNLQDDEITRFLFREYILSSWNIAREYSSLLGKTYPQAVLVFNGQFFPEAIVRWLSQQKGIFTLTHEASVQALGGFFTSGEATAYPISLPEDFSLSPAQNARLDAYLEKRMKGNFTMAGIRFWPEMSKLSQSFLEKAARFQQIVPVFTNVIFDTSQPHSNVVFEDMFAWLDLVLELIRQHPQTLFVLRAHPDEKRAGKESQQTVAGWVTKNRVTEAAGKSNVIFVDSFETISSYELIERSKFIMTYNSTIGLEATILGKPVLAAGKSRFTPYPIVFFPDSPEAYRSQAEILLGSDEVKVPPDYRENARRFLYFMLYRSSLPFDDFLESTLVPGVVQLKNFSWQTIANSPVMKTIINGIVDQTPFLIDQD